VILVSLLETKWNNVFMGIKITICNENRNRKCLELNTQYSWMHHGAWNICFKSDGAFFGNEMIGACQVLHAMLTSMQNYSPQFWIHFKKENARVTMNSAQCMLQNVHWKHAHDNFNFNWLNVFGMFSCVNHRRLFVVLCFLRHT